MGLQGMATMVEVPMNELKEGDILLLYDTADNTTPAHQLIKASQRSTGSYSAGEWNLVHAVMWTRRNLSIAPAGGIVFDDPEEQQQWRRLLWDKSDEQISEASGSHGVREHWLRRGHYAAYRIRPEYRELGLRAAEIARTWASSGKIKYGKPDAAASIVASSKDFGPNAQRRALQYAKDADNAWPEWAKQIVFGEEAESGFLRGDDRGGAYCSQFIIAAYQAACLTLNMELTGMARRDAKHSNAADLCQALRFDQHFYYAGNVVVIASEHDNT